MSVTLLRYEEQMEISSHKYRKEVKDLNYQLQEAESRIQDMQDQVSVIMYYQVGEELDVPGSM